MTTVRQHLEAIRDQAAKLPAGRGPHTEQTMNDSIYGHARQALDLLNAGSRTSDAGNQLIVVLDQPPVNV